MYLDGIFTKPENYDWGDNVIDELSLDVPSDFKFQPYDRGRKVGSLPYCFGYLKLELRESGGLPSAVPDVQPEEEPVLSSPILSPVWGW